MCGNNHIKIHLLWCFDFTLTFSNISKPSILHSLSIHIQRCSVFVMKLTKASWTGFLKKLLIQANFNNCKNRTTVSHCSQCKHITGHFQVAPYKYTDRENVKRKPTWYREISIAAPLPDLRKYCFSEHFLSLFRFFVYHNNYHKLLVLNSTKSMNLFTLSNQNKNHFYGAYWNTIHYCVNHTVVYFFKYFYLFIIIIIIIIIVIIISRLHTL